MKIEDIKKLHMIITQLSLGKKVSFQAEEDLHDSLVELCRAKLIIKHYVNTDDVPPSFKSLLD